MSLRPIVRSLIRQPLRLPTERRGGWLPLSLFAAGEQGGWWDPSDFGTMFQDSAGTTPVTAVGQPVGLIRDKSGRGNHRTQGTAASRPTLQQDGSGFFYLSYDGVDDGMATGSVDFTGTDKITICTGILKASDAVRGAVIGLGSSPTVAAGGFNIEAPGSALGNFAGNIGGTTQIAFTFAQAAPFSTVLTVADDISAPLFTVRSNGTVKGTSASSQGTGTFTNNPLFFARQAGTSNPFNGREYQTIIRGAASTAAQIAQAERFVGSRMGIAL